RVDAEIRKIRQEIERGKMDKQIGRVVVKEVAKDKLQNVEIEVETNEVKAKIKEKIENFLNSDK
ncbi:hypothetical protein ThvES_00020840, partial [Thiovulum sp. ES]